MNSSYKKYLAELIGTFALVSSVCGAALSSLWLFWLAPIVGGVIGGYIGRWMHDE